MSKSAATQRAKIKADTPFPLKKRRFNRVIIKKRVSTSGSNRKVDELQSTKGPGPSSKVARSSKRSGVSVTRHLLLNAKARYTQG